MSRRAGWGAALVPLVVACSDELPPPPPQPIAFSHLAHAEQEIDCSRCHQGAATEAQAGLPPISACAVCHRRRAIPDHPEVQKFMTALEAGDTIFWRKVHHIPDQAMVHFKHDAHVQAGVECSTCHGDVAQMTVAQQVVDVANMGWCVSCHKQNEASVDCLVCHH